MPTKSPTQQGQRCHGNKGNQHQWRCQCNKGSDVSKHNKDKDSSATRAKTLAQGRQRCQCNKGKDTIKMIAKTPAQQWCMRSRMATHISISEVSQQLLRFSKFLSFALSSHETATATRVVHHVAAICRSQRGNNRQRSGGWDWEGYRYNNQGGKYHGGKQ